VAIAVESCLRFAGPIAYSLASSLVLLLACLESTLHSDLGRHPLPELLAVLLLVQVVGWLAQREQAQ